MTEELFSKKEKDYVTSYKEHLFEQYKLYFVLFSGFSFVLISSLVQASLKLFMRLKEFCLLHLLFFLYF